MGRTACTRVTFTFTFTVCWSEERPCYNFKEFLHCVGKILCTYRLSAHVLLVGKKRMRVLIVSTVMMISFHRIILPPLLKLHFILSSDQQLKLDRCTKVVKIKNHFTSFAIRKLTEKGKFLLPSWRPRCHSGDGAVLQIGRSLVPFQMVSLEFFIDIILPIALWPWGRLILWQKWVPGEFPGGKCGRCVRLTTLPPPCAVVMKSGNLNFLEPSGPLQACNGPALPFTSS